MIVVLPLMPRMAFLSMNIMAHLQSSIRLATAIFLAVFALAIVLGLGTAGFNYWEKSQAKVYETAKIWTEDLQSNLQLSAKVRTKMVDGRLYMIFATDAYPPYLKQQRLSVRDRGTGFFVSFVDNDGFAVFSKAVPLGEMTGIVDETGNQVGLKYETDEYLDLATYASFSTLDVRWNISTDLPSASATSDEQGVAGPDHCAANLSKTERLKRLATYGAIRQIGEGSFSVGVRRLTFFTHDNSLLDCQ